MRRSLKRLIPSPRAILDNQSLRVFGSLVCATVCSAAGYLIIQGLWRWNLIRQIKKRRARYASVSANRPSSSRQT